MLTYKEAKQISQSKDDIKFYAFPLLYWHTSILSTEETKLNQEPILAELREQILMKFGT